MEALEKCSNYDQAQKDMILELTHYCIRNSVVQYKGNWFKSLEGLPTGGTESASLVNIYVKWGLDSVLLNDDQIKKTGKDF